jgi:hypothetical protein
VQVEPSMSDGKLVQEEDRVQANVRYATFRLRRDLDMLFVMIDPTEGRMSTAWLVPSPKSAELAPTPNGKGRRVFNASSKRPTGGPRRRTKRSRNWPSSSVNRRARTGVDMTHLDPPPTRSRVHRPSPRITHR